MTCVGGGDSGDGDGRAKPEVFGESLVINWTWTRGERRGRCQGLSPHFWLRHPDRG